MATLKLELIGDDSDQRLRVMHAEVASVGNDEWTEALRPPPNNTWVAEITGRDARYGYARRFLGGPKDYSESNGIGSRGVYRYFELESGKLYEVKERVSWSRSRRYWCTVNDAGQVVELTDEEAGAWLSRGST